jgi:hypothetical protein
MRPAARTDPLVCTAMMACFLEMAANLRCTSHPFCLRGEETKQETRMGQSLRGGVRVVVPRRGGEMSGAFREKQSVSYRPMTSSFSATSYVRSTSPPSPSCMSFPTTLVILPFVRGSRRYSSRGCEWQDPRSFPESVVVFATRPKGEDAEKTAF